MWRAGIQLTCGNLMQLKIQPDDPVVKGLSRVEIALADLTDSEVTLDGVAPGDYRIVYAQAKNASGALIANGCTPDNTVASGETTTVEVEVYRLR